ncbi:LolA-related protein [Methylocaldum sp.]|uniref:LolA-related protein n=1 Tax=Methylocaldum sp. TaxID=1969727 RepID=UPI002D3C056B|nr:LolA-related protein [Methylocaldum sp.]HYE37028.1 LolA-related protein [Methylocaldum sp.]
MTSGIKTDWAHRLARRIRHISRWLGILLGFVFTATLASAAERWDIDALMSALSRIDSGEKRYTEIKTMALLKEPMRLSGTLSYRAPSFLEKHVLSPFEERYTVDGDSLTIENPGKGIKQTLSLASQPAIWAFVESIRAPLAGDLATLNRFYKVNFGGSERNWLLALVPTEPDMARLVRFIRIRGSGDRFDRIEIEETGGDVSVMTIEHQP